MRPGPRRVLAALCLFALLAGLALHYSAAGSDRVTTLESRDRVASPAAHAGETVYFWARVDAVDDGTLTVRTAGTTVTVVGHDADAEVGDVVQVAGTLRADATVVADRVVVSPRERRPRLYVVSALGGALAAGAFLREWGVDPRRIAFVPREEDA